MLTSVLQPDHAVTNVPHVFLSRKLQCLVLKGGEDPDLRHTTLSQWLWVFFSCGNRRSHVKSDGTSPAGFQGVALRGQEL